MSNFNQIWPRPTSPKPIVLIGAGGIVRDSHLPAYRNAGFPVAGIWNRSPERAKSVADAFDIGQVFETLEEVAAQRDVVFDIATSPEVYPAILNMLPDGAPVLIQKPMGLNLQEANEILSICRRKNLLAAVNFQLRFSPMMLAIRDAMAKGFFGTMTEIEVHLNLMTPWHLFPNLVGDPRVEIVAHSVHYIDLIQSLVGEPNGVFTRSFGFPGQNLADTRTTNILDYGDTLRVTLSINHHHDFGRSQQDSCFRFEGTEGAAVAKLGVLLDYPTGEPDELWMGARGNSMETVPLTGSWFPDAFEQVMSNLQRFAAGEDGTLHTSVESAWRTMAIVEACYDAVQIPTQPIQKIPDHGAPA